MGADDPRRILIGITGGIAAYKIPLLVRALKSEGLEVKTALTRAAQSLVGEGALRTVSGNPVYGDDTPSLYDMDHIRLSEWADCMLICPATANTIAKIATGIADYLITTSALSFKGPLLIAPAMNTAMWENPATRTNISTLRQRGVHILPVGSGALACGDAGPGRMISIEAIVEYVLGAYLPKPLEGKRVLISSGPTAEPIDPVRVLTNRSSGKMGAALARAAILLGAEVSVVSGHSQTTLPEEADVTFVETASQMAESVKERYNDADICILAAAVSDYRPARVASEKLDRRSEDTPSLKLVANEDIAAALGAARKHQFLIGFALETSEDLNRAEEKMRKKNCDMMVLNTVENSLTTDSSTVTILTSDGDSRRFESMEKRRIAREILLYAAARAGYGT